MFGDRHPFRVQFPWRNIPGTVKLRESSGKAGGFPGGIETQPEIRNDNMKKRNAALLFVCGMCLGISLALCLGATGKATNSPAQLPAQSSAQPPAQPPAKDWSRLKIVGCAGGQTGLFDPDTGRFYMYDVTMVNCFAIRELTTLGEPMKQIKN
jgi:hypothetical protein